MSERQPRFSQLDRLSSYREEEEDRKFRHKKWKRNQRRRGDEELVPVDEFIDPEEASDE